MALSPNINNREFDKFVDIAGETFVRVTSGVGSLAAIKQAILNANDMTEVVTTADFGTIKERVTSIAYSAASVGTYTATKVLNYTLIGGKYRYDGSVWSVV